MICVYLGARSCIVNASVMTIKCMSSQNALSFSVNTIILRSSHRGRNQWSLILFKKKLLVYMQMPNVLGETSTFTLNSHRPLASPFTFQTSGYAPKGSAHSLSLSIKKG